MRRSCLRLIYGSKSEAIFNLETATRLAEGGFSVFPCGQDRKPLVKWRDVSTSDPKLVRLWWDRWPDAIPAIDCGKSGLVVIDADRHGGPDGVAAFEALAEKHGLPEGVPVVETPRQGQHFYFRNSDELGNSSGSLPLGIDVRGVGGFVFAPGAVLSDGKTWQARDSLDSFIAAFRERRIPDLSDWLTRTIRTPRQRAAASGLTNENQDFEAEQSARREPTARECRYAEAGLEKECEKLAATESGSRNNRLNDAAHAMGRFVGAGWLNETTVREALLAACQENGLCGEDGERACRATIRSGLRAGKRRPAKPIDALTKMEDERPRDGSKLRNRGLRFFYPDELKQIGDASYIVKQWLLISARN